MSIVKISQFAHSNISSETLSSLEKSAGGEQFTLGTDVQTKDIQILSESHDASDSTSPSSSAASSALGQPHTTVRVQLDGPAFGPKAAATAPAIEFAQSWFPISIATPDFQKKIEADFARFDKLFMPGTVGHVACLSGWVIEDQTHPDLAEKAKSFICVRGWESMEMFQKSISENEGFKEAIGILHGWKAPFKMWHTEKLHLNALA